MKDTYKIMVVEDDALVMISDRAYLNVLGFKDIVEAATGENAIILDEKEQPDIILMDIMLAGAMDGITAAETILSRRYVPVIFMTGYAMNDFFDRVSRVKPAAYLSKPITEIQLQTALSKAISEIETRAGNTQ